MLESIEQKKQNQDDFFNEFNEPNGDKPKDQAPKSSLENEVLPKIEEEKKQLQE